MLDSVEELLQMTTSAVYKLNLRKSYDELTACCGTVAISFQHPWDFAMYKKWFTKTFINQDSITCSNESTDPDAAADLSALKSVLAVKAAYLQLWTQAYMNVNEDVS